MTTSPNIIQQFEDTIDRLLKNGVPQEALIYIARNQDEKKGAFYEDKHEVIEIINEIMKKNESICNLCFFAFDGRDVKGIAQELWESRWEFKTSEWNDYLAKLRQGDLISKTQNSEFWLYLEEHDFLN